MRWIIGVEGGEALGQRLGALARHPLLDGALRGAATAVRERSRDGLDGSAETVPVEGGFALRAPDDLLGLREFGTPDRPAEPLLRPALRDARPGLVQAATAGLRSALRRAARRSR